MSIDPNLLLSVVLVGNLLAVAAIGFAVLGWLRTSSIERSLGNRLSTLEAERDRERERRQTAEDRVASLQGELGKAIRNAKHGKTHREVHNAVQAVQFKALRALEELEASRAFMQYAIGLCVHIGHGGDPDANPTQWLGQSDCELDDEGITARH